MNSALDRTAMFIEIVQGVIIDDATTHVTATVTEEKKKKKRKMKKGEDLEIVVTSMWNECAKEVSKMANNATSLALKTIEIMNKSQKVYFRGISGFTTTTSTATAAAAAADKDLCDVEAVRDSIEREIGECIRECQEHVRMCERVIEKFKRESMEIDIENNNSNRQFVAHLFGVSLIASERVEEVAKRLDSMRAKRFRAQAEEAMRLERRRGSGVGAGAVANELRRRLQSSSNNNNIDYSRRNSKRDHNSNEGDDKLESEEENDGFEQQQQLKQESVNTETDMLIAELVDISRGAQLTEMKIVELSALSSMFANVVSKQSQQIEQIYSEALKSTKFLEIGNFEMRKTISRRRSGSNYIAFVLFIATFAVLFLDWYND